MVLRLVAAGQQALKTNSSLRETLQRRAYWQEIVKVRVDRDGKRRHEDPVRVVRRFQEQRRSDGEGLLDLYSYNEKHEKAWMRRKRLADQKRYDFDKKHVMDLAKYIQFVQDNTEKK